MSRRKKIGDCNICEATGVKVAVMIRLTTDSGTSSHGVPVFVDADGRAMDYADGFKALRKERGWSVRDLADKCSSPRKAISPRTIQAYEQGRMPSVAVLAALSWHLKMLQNQKSAD